MCVYSTTWYPLSEEAPDAAVTTALTVDSPAAAPAGGSMVKLTVTFSSSRAKAIGADAGVAVQPAGACSATDAVAAPFWLLATVTWRVFRLKAEATESRPAGTTTISGSTVTLNAGETFSSDRFSPATRSL